MKKLLLIPVILMLIAGLILSGCGPSSPTPPAPPASSPVAPPPASSPVAPPPASSPAAPPPASSPAAAPIKLLYASFDTSTAPDAIAVQEWAKELEQKTNGRVKVEFSWNSALGPMPGYYDLLTSGACDMIPYLSFMRPGLTPVLDISGLPYYQQDTLSGTRAWNEVLKKGYLDKEFAEVKIVMLVCTRATTIMSTKSITTMADFKGLKIHSGTPAMTESFTALGSSPSMIPPMDIYPALQKKVVDATTGTPVMLDSLKLGEVTKYLVPAFGSLAQPYLMNKNFWNKLPPDIQAIIDDMTVKYSERMAALHDQTNKTAIDNFVANGGVVQPLSDAVLTQMDPLLVNVWQKYMADLTSKGLPAKDVVDLVWNTLKANGVERPAIGYTPGP